VGLLSRVRADVPSLVLQAVEGLLAQRALVRPREVLSLLVLALLGILQQRRHEAHGSGGHGGLLWGRWDSGLRAQTGLLAGARGVGV
jgi:hypothetical protein